VHFCSPLELIPDPACLNVNFTMCETSCIPAAWVAKSRRHDLVIVPTSTARHAWIAGGVSPALVRVCPLGIDAYHFSHTHFPLRLWSVRGDELSRFRLRFLTIGAIDPRANLLGLLRAWIRATTPDDDAVLVIVLNDTAPSPRLAAFRLATEALTLELGRGLEGSAPVWFHQEPIAEEHLPGLYTAATHYVTLSHGEGWDQHVLEAGACGLSLIAPNHSAYAACLDPATARLIPSHAVPCSAAEGYFTGSPYAGLHWWDPDEDGAVEAIRAAMSGGDSLKGAARDRILRDYTWEQAARRLLSLLAELQVRRDGPRMPARGGPHRRDGVGP
jgi:glycosyltransferase involved in cell wall biosynthesis